MKRNDVRWVRWSSSETCSRSACSPRTRRVRAIERDLGLALLHRTSRRVRLTDAGRELATRLPPALRQIDSALAAARATAEGGWEI
jgi:DNA-binding transcriptional LysR family regulator